MPKTLQFRRGSTAELSTETGSLAELFVDTSKNTVILMDGSTAGGHELVSTTASQSLSNKTLVTPTFSGKISGSFITLPDQVYAKNILSDGKIEIPIVEGNSALNLRPGTSGTIYIQNWNTTTGDYRNQIYISGSETRVDFNPFVIDSKLYISNLRKDYTKPINTSLTYSDDTTSYSKVYNEYVLYQPSTDISFSCTNLTSEKIYNFEINIEQGDNPKGLTLVTVNGSEEEIQYENGQAPTNTAFNTEIYKLKIFSRPETTGYNVLAEFKSYSVPTATVDSTIDSTIDSTVASTIDSTIDSTVTSTIDSTVASTIDSTIDSTVASTIDSTIDSTVTSTIDSTVDSTVTSTIDSTVDSSTTPQTTEYIITNGSYYSGAEMAYVMYEEALDTEFNNALANLKTGDTVLIDWYDSGADIAGTSSLTLTSDSNYDGTYTPPAYVLTGNHNPPYDVPTGTETVTKITI